MEKIKTFIKTHLKKFIIGGVSVICTFGIYGVYKIIKSKEES